MNDFPTIDIRYGRFLAPFFDSYAEQETPTIARPSKNEIQRNIEHQRKNWKEIEEKILTALPEATGLTFLETFIPVYIVPSCEGAFSDPIVISSLQIQRFADVLTHELIHRLGDSNQAGMPIREVGKKLHPDIEDTTLRDHIFVHAIHQYLYLEILENPQRLTEDIESCEGSYKKAWGIVQREGYKKIIDLYKNSYL